MKKSKILSMLLAACMVLPCLPVTATATAAPTTPTNTPVGVNLLDPYGTTDLTDPANWTMSTGQTATQIKVDDPDGNGSNTYLRTDDFVTNAANYHLYLDATKIPTYAANKNYIVKIGVRTQSDGTETYDQEFRFNYRYRVSGDTGTELIETAGDTMDYYSVSYTAGSGANLRLNLRGGRNARDIIPMEIDNISVYDASNTTTPLYTYTFEGESTGIKSWKNRYDFDKKDGSNISGDDVGKNAEIVTEYDHLRVNAATATDAYVKYDNNIVLTPGKYELTFDARQSYFFNKSNHNSAAYASENAKGLQESVLDSDGRCNTTNYATNYDWWILADNEFASNGHSNRTQRYHILYKMKMALHSSGSYATYSYTVDTVNANYRDVKLTLATDKALTNVKLDGEAFNGTFHVTDSWDSYKLTFEVPEGQTVTLSSLSFGGTGKAYDNDAFDLSRISLKLIPDGASRPVYGADDNFLDNAKETYNGGIYTDHDLNTANGYITISQRDWSNKGTYAEPGLEVFAVCTGGKYDPDFSYYMQFDARNHVPSDGNQSFFFRFCDINVANDTSNTQTLSSDSEWQTFIFSHSMNDSDYENKNLRFRIVRSSLWSSTDPSTDPFTIWAGIPVDFDNIIIWREPAGGDGVYTDADKANNNLLYSENFNNKDTKYELEAGTNYYATNRILVETKLYSHNFENSFGRLSVASDSDTPLLSYTDLNNGEGHGEGVYAFSAQLRTHYNYENIRYTPADIDKFNTSNNHKAKITFTMTPVDGGSDVTVTRTADVNYLWSTFEAAVTVEKGYKLTKIDITPEFNTTYAIPTAARGLDFANAYLGYYDYETIETQDSKNYLADTTIYTENALPKEVVVEDTNGYIYVSERVERATAPVAIKVNGTVSANKTYFIEYDIKAEGSADKMEIRPTLRSGSEEGSTAVRLKGNRASGDGYFEATSGSGLTTYDASSDGNGPTWYLSELKNGVMYHFKGSFVPLATSSNFYYILREGRGEYPHAIYIDNFRIYDENGVNVCNYDFQNDGDIDLAYKPNPSNTSYEIEHILPVNYTLYTPMDNTQPMKLTYDIQLTEAEKVEGKYQFKTEVKLAEASEGTAKARVLFNFSDGSSQVHYIELTEKWSTIGIADRLERYPTLETVTVEFDTDVPVMMRDSSLYITYRWQYGKPNTGIVMVLIKKMQGMMTDPWRGLA